MTPIRGKVGPFIGFLGIAALVLGGLGYVTYAALRIEKDQRIANAEREIDRMRAEKAREQEERYQEELRRYDLKRAADLRLALWYLDSTVIPALAREDSRPYPHYVSLYSPFPAVTQTGVACEPGQVYLPSPLMTAALPKWMLLHFQIDPVNGWTSPQVIPESLQKMLRRQPIELALHNVDAEHKNLLAELKSAYPARSFLATLRQNGINVDNNLAQQELPNPSNPIYNNSYSPQNPASAPGQNALQPQPQQGQFQGQQGNDQQQVGGRGGNFDLPDAFKRLQVTSRAKNEGIWAYLNDGRNYASLEALFPSKKLDLKQAEVRLVETEIKSAQDGAVKKRLESKLDSLKKEVDDLKRAIQQPVDVELGSMTPMWLPSPEKPKHLVLIRPAQVGNTAAYQGIVLDWVQLQEILKSTIADLFPDARLVPVAAVDPAKLDRSMTALPVDLEPGAGCASRTTGFGLRR